MTREEAIKRIIDIRKIYARYVEIVTENENEALDMAIKALELNNEQWRELKETITEMSDNDGTCTQQEVCKFLVNYMNVLEKQMQEPKIGHWIPVSERLPEESGEYLITIKDRIYLEISWFYPSDKKWSYRNAEIIAWMPLPQPYKAESEESK